MLASEPDIEVTGETHLLRAFGKLGVSDRTAAVTTAIERGDIPPPGPVTPRADHYIPTGLLDLCAVIAS